jgi:hypothetical protein
MSLNYFRQQRHRTAALRTASECRIPGSASCSIAADGQLAGDWISVSSVDRKGSKEVGQVIADVVYVLESIGQLSVGGDTVTSNEPIWKLSVSGSTVLLSVTYGWPGRSIQGKDHGCPCLWEE